MKYDSSMTQFHGDIVSAIKAMIFPGKAKAKELASEGSPVPLREFLKIYGKDRFGGRNFECTPNAFFVVFDNIILNNSGDKKLQFSWSQTATFIRNNAAEIFDESEEGCKESNMENEKSSPEIDVLDLDVKTYNTLKRAGINTIADVERLADNLTGTIQLPEAHRIAIEAYKAYQYSQGRQEAPTEISAAVEQDKQPSDFPCDNCGYDEKGCCNYPETPDDYCVMGDKQVPITKEHTEISDKYAEAVQLNAQIMTSARAAQQNLYDMAVGFKKMRDDKLYKELGYDNFGDYCEAETGMTRSNVYNYINVVEKLPRDFVQSIGQIGMTKLQLLTTINDEDRTEIIENTDLESTTVRDLKKQIEQLRKSEEDIKAELELAQFHEKQSHEALNRVADASKANYEKYQEERHKNDDLEKRIRELENRPVEVAVQSDEETLAEKDQEISELKGEVERLSNKNVKVFAVRLTLDEYEKLIQIVCGGCRGGNDPVILEAVKKAQIIRL